MVAGGGVVFWGRRGVGGRGEEGLDASRVCADPVCLSVCLSVSLSFLPALEGGVVTSLIRWGGGSGEVGVRGVRGYATR